MHGNDSLPMTPAPSDRVLHRGMQNKEPSVFSKVLDDDEVTVATTVFDESFGWNEEDYSLSRNDSVSMCGSFNTPPRPQQRDDSKVALDLPPRIRKVTDIICISEGQGDLPTPPFLSNVHKELLNKDDKDDGNDINLRTPGADRTKLVWRRSSCTRSTLFDYFPKRRANELPYFPFDDDIPLQSDDLPLSFQQELNNPIKADPIHGYVLDTFANLSTPPFAPQDEEKRGNGESTKVLPNSTRKD